jgi:hypothetical protein
VITVVTGPPGNGKSLYGVRAIAHALERGKPVATNIALRSDLGPFVARRGNVVRRLVPGRTDRVAELRERHVFSSDDPNELLRVRLRGAGESRGLMVLDEAPDWLNSREFSDRDRKGLTRWFRKHRHYGWDVLLIAQDLEMIDKQVRVNYEYHVHMRNLRRAKVAGVTIFPVNLFLGTHTWHQTRGAAAPIIVKRETFTLGWWKDLYDTHAAAAALDQELDETAIWLPADARPAAA